MPARRARRWIVALLRYYRKADLSPHRSLPLAENGSWCATIYFMASRDLSRSAAVQDYCKEIFALESRTDLPVSTNALAERLGLTPASVSAMLNKLERLGLVIHARYRGARLTPDGRRVALEVIRHHRLIESFLARALGMPWDRVHAEAEVLEHVISAELARLIDERLGHPTTDPHGDPIPTADLQLDEPVTQSMESLGAGDEGIFVRVSDSDPEMLRYLAGCGIAPGDGFGVRERQPFGGPLFVVFGEREHAIGGQLARAMRVVVAAEPSRPDGEIRESSVDGPG